MARHLPKMDLTFNSPKSPAGFWPHPEKEIFYKTLTPPWRVPMRRKTRGSKHDFYYDLTNDELIWKKSGEVTTFNRFELIDPEEPLLNASDHEETYIFEEETIRKPEEDLHKLPEGEYPRDIPNSDMSMPTSHDSLKSQQGEYPLTISNNDMPFFYAFISANNEYNDSFHEFMENSNKHVNNNKHYMYSNKGNFCSGYFPDFITLDNMVGYNASEGNNYSHYYLYTKNKKYLKPLSNPKSSYNNKYFDNMNFAYKVSKKFNWRLKEQSNVRFKESYLYRKLKSSGETRISIPEESQDIIVIKPDKYILKDSGETRISIP